MSITVCQKERRMSVTQRKFGEQRNKEATNEGEEQRSGCKKKLPVALLKHLEEVLPGKNDSGLE